jgi:hypothetical protein
MVAKRSANELSEARGVGGTIIYQGRGPYLTLDGVTGMKERGEERIANEGDFATLLDRSATRTAHGNPLAYLANGGPHDYHEGVARLNVGFASSDRPDFDQPSSDRPGGADASYRSASLPQAKAP